MICYNEAKRHYAGRRGHDCRKLGPGKNTRLLKRGTNYAVQLHNTDIVTYMPDGACVLDSGGWKTVTTKERLNLYSPARVNQANGVWYVAYNGTEYIYQDGMILKGGKCFDADGRDLRPANECDSEHKIKKWRKTVREFAKTYIEKLLSSEIPKPSGGDCWLCGIEDYPDQRAHISEHIKEGYFVSRMICNALEQGRFCQVDKWIVGAAFGYGKADECARTLELFARACHVKRITRNFAAWLLNQLGEVPTVGPTFG